MVRYKSGPFSFMDVWPHAFSHTNSYQTKNSPETSDEFRVACYLMLQIMLSVNNA